MTGQRATQTPPRALFVLRGGDSTGTGDAVPGPEPVTVPLMVSGGTEAGTGPGTAPSPVPAAVPMTVPERAVLAGKHWASTAADGAGQLWLHPDRLGHSLYNGKPGSMAEHRAYIKSRRWVPPDLDGKAAKFIAGTGIVFYAITGILQIPLLILYAALDRMLRTAGLIAAVLVFVFAVVPHIHP